MRLAGGAAASEALGPPAIFEAFSHGRSERLEIVASAVVLFVGSYWGFKLSPLRRRSLSERYLSSLNVKDFTPSVRRFPSCSRASDSLKQTYFSVASGDLAKTRVTLTMVGGKVVFEATK